MFDFPMFISMKIVLTLKIDYKQVFDFVQKKH